MSIFREYSSDIKLVVHTAAQPSHDWATLEPLTDFAINANGTLNVLEITRLLCPDAVFIFTSTNKVYGDKPEHLPLVELETRWEIDKNHRFFTEGIDESMSIDYTNHTLFGASKLAADIVAQEYGRHFGMKVGVFRCGCLTGPKHSGVELHGFLSYLMKCAFTGRNYTIYGHKGKQVRDNIHSYDLVNMFWHFYQNPQRGEVYHAGGGRFVNCSMKEAIVLCEEITSKKMHYSYSENSRVADVRWWISDISKFKRHYPDWNLSYGIKDILLQIYDSMTKRLAQKT